MALNATPIVASYIRKVTSYGLRPVFLVVANVFNTDSYVTMQIDTF